MPKLSVAKALSEIPIQSFSLEQGKRVTGTEISAVVITGLAVVFAALIILILLVWAYGKIFDAINANKKEKQRQELAEKAARVSETAATQASVQQNSLADETADEVDDSEVVAAISAVIAQIADEEGKQLRIASIKPSAPTRISGRSAWALEGLRQNTKPF